jgi:bifunctional DNase/RNase
MQIEMSIKGLMVDPITNTPIVILRDKDGQRVLPIWVGIFEANAIALQIENVTTPRPMTHDLLRNVIQDLKATVQKIVVCDLQENTFYALIYGWRAWIQTIWESTRCNFRILESQDLRILTAIQIPSPTIPRS